ncbi:TetR/AcrR family transcriptional regulator [Cryptosporangium minutisporangium]|uniref:HTH tetR-type domain-containing protein n=1 Tax=Cryptosporangium minutisporangium TaxID=113569 RepID=A0ABP6SRQ5_9ACTN
MSSVNPDSEKAEKYPLRSQKARQTRLAVITAAIELFSAHGYAGTTIEAIAARAGVARPTVFTAVPGGKPQLLKEARDVAIAGDDEPVPIPERPWMRHAMAQTDPRELIRLQAGNYLRVNTRLAPIDRALKAAADPALAELQDVAPKQRYFGALMTARRLAELDGLRAGLTPEDAADVIYGLNEPELYLTLVRERGWTGERYAAFLADQLTYALLPPMV